MNTIEQRLGFDRIRTQLVERCSTHRGATLMQEVEFSTDAAEVDYRQGLTEEFRLALQMEQEFPNGELVDFGAEVSKLAVEGTFLEGEELLQLRVGLKMVGEAAGFFVAREERYPLGAAMSQGVKAFPEIVGHIDTIIDRHGEVRDGASPELYDLRRSIRSHEGQAAKRLQAVLAEAIRQGIVDADASLSVREGRTVIPVSASNKRKLKGFVHDESATGKTVYIEPVEVVEINNALKELEYAARREEIRILTELAAYIRPHSEELAASGEYLAQFDMVRAKARWAVSNGAYKAIVSEDCVAPCGCTPPTAATEPRQGTQRGRATRLGAQPTEEDTCDFGPQCGW